MLNHCDRIPFDNGISQLPNWFVPRGSHFGVNDVFSSIVMGR
jgi:hypothetical protein